MFSLCVSSVSLSLSSGREYQEGQAVYQDQDTATGVFPDGTPFNRSQNRKPHYVFVWKAWGTLDLLLNFFYIVESVPFLTTQLHLLCCHNLITFMRDSMFSCGINENLQQDPVSTVKYIAVSIGQSLLLNSFHQPRLSRLRGNSKKKTNVIAFKGVTGRWQVDHPPHSPSEQTTSQWALTTWSLSSITAAVETGSSLLAMPLQSSPSQVTDQNISKLHVVLNY